MKFTETRTFRIIIVTTIFFILLNYFLVRFWVYDESLNNRSDYKQVSMKTAEKFLGNNKVKVVYYGNFGSIAYMKLKSGDLISVSHIDSNKFDKLIEGTVVRDISELRFKDVVADVRLMYIYLGIAFYACTILGIYISKRNKLNGGAEFASNIGTPKNYNDEPIVDTGVKTFSDIAGLKEVKKDMRNLVDFIINREVYNSAGAKLPKGVILYGPPGTGKTLLAKAVANEAKVPFFYMSGSEFIEMYVGVGAKRVRDLFEKARKSAPCIIFIDEIDSIGGKREGHDSSGEDRKTINALLTEMDGFKESENIIVIGATNRLEDLDPALVRPGRFTNKFCVPLPQTANERREVINLYIQNKSLSDDVNLDALSKETVGFSPAKIEALLNEAAIIQVQKSKSFISQKEIDEAMDKILLQGHIREDQSQRNKNELEIVAWHEAGHALLGKLLGKSVTKVSILSSTSGAGGVTFSVPKDSELYSVQDLRDEVKELYGGRLAEFLYFNKDSSKITTGASNDIERATSIIKRIISDYGMSEDYGLLNLTQLGVDKESTIEKEVALAKELEKETLVVLELHFDSLESIANLLITNEVIYENDLENILNC